jgi:hypothetical protein
MMKGKKRHSLPHSALIHKHAIRHQVSRAGVRTFTPPRHGASLRQRPIAQLLQTLYEGNGTDEKSHGR